MTDWCGTPRARFLPIFIFMTPTIWIVWLWSVKIAESSIILLIEAIVSTVFTFLLWWSK